MKPRTLAVELQRLAITYLAIFVVVTCGLVAIKLGAGDLGSHYERMNDTYERGWMDK
jgi:hypothetical protein